MEQKLIKLEPISWKIMLEVFSKGNPTVVREVPIEFQPRGTGESHYSFEQVYLYIKHAGIVWWRKHKMSLRRMGKFLTIGAISGVAIHFTLLYLLTDVVGLWYLLSAIIAAIATATSSYFLNHKITFKGMENKNKTTGWIKYQLLSGASDALYVGLLALFVEVVGLWYIFGAIASLAILFPLKYKVASTLIWSKKKNPDAPNHDWISFYKGGFLQKRWKQAIAKTVWGWTPDTDGVLNVGCGSSPIAVKYPKSTNVDANKEKLAYLKDKLPSIATVHSQAENLPFDREQFGGVICAELIEHSDRPEEVVREISRVVKRCGRVVITTPDYSKLMWKLSKGFIGMEDDHVSHFTRESLEALCKGYGLRPLEYKYVAGCDLCELFEKV